MLYQTQPNYICQNSGKMRFLGKCRNPRCSLECYREWGRKEAAILNAYLKRLPENTLLYTGTLTINADIDKSTLLSARKGFAALFRKYMGRLLNFAVFRNTAN